MISKIYNKHYNVCVLFSIFKNFKISKNVKFLEKVNKPNTIIFYSLYPSFNPLNLNFINKFLFLFNKKTNLNKVYINCNYNKLNIYSYPTETKNKIFVTQQFICFHSVLTNTYKSQKHYSTIIVKSSSNFLVKFVLTIDSLKIYNFFYLFKKKYFVKVCKKKFNFLKFLKYMVNLNDKKSLIGFYSNINFFSNKYLTKYLIFYNNELSPNFKRNTLKLYNNYYPMTKSNPYAYSFFVKKFKFNKNINHLLFTNKIVVKFLENLLKKKIYIKILNNKYYKIKSYYFNAIVKDYKNFKPLYFKKFSFIDFIEIIWYSFMLKDLKMLSSWVTKFMESINFKSHKKFISLFNNFINKYSGVFIDVLGVKGFFFDIRGKVGVTGSSKKRHLCFKFGSLKKSSKSNKINFNQGLVRTYSGVMGLTYIINF